jgi:Zn-dependent protease
MLSLLFNGQVFLFAVLLFTIVFSLTFHEFGHAFSAKLLGDDTAERLGRLTLNPVAHIDPIGLLMVITIGFGYAKPVPITPSRMQKPWGGAAVAAAGPFMNLLIAIVAVNVFALANKTGLFELTEQRATALIVLAQINLLLMLFNLLPLGPLDGHWIMSWLLPKQVGITYDRFNNQYGSHLFLALILLSVMGVPIFSFLMDFSQQFIGYLDFIS